MKNAGDHKNIKLNEKLKIEKSKVILEFSRFVKYLARAWGEVRLPSFTIHHHRKKRRELRWMHFAKMKDHR